MNTLFLRFLVVVICVASLLAAKAATVAAPAPKQVSSQKGKAKISSSLKDIDVNGLEALNFNLHLPFEFQDWKFGISFDNIAKITRHLPSSVNAKKTFKLSSQPAVAPVKGKIAPVVESSEKMTLDASYSPGAGTLNLGVELGDFSNDFKGVTFNVNTITDVVNKQLDNLDVIVSAVRDKAKVVGKWNAFSHKVDATVDFSPEKSTTLQLKVNSEDVDPVLSVSQEINPSNIIAPSMSLKSGSMKYGWTRKWAGGKLCSTLEPNEEVVINWQEDAVNGHGSAWNTKVVIPIDGGLSSIASAPMKVSVSRKWVE